MGDNWPQDDDLLALTKESAEIRRAWALVGGLAKTITKERGSYGVELRRDGQKMVGERPETWSDRIRSLEGKIVRLKKHVTDIEECRAFELESERLLVEALVKVGQAMPIDARYIAVRALTVNDSRKGPRPDGS